MMRLLTRSCALFAMTLIANAASAQSYPVKPVRIIVAFAPGGPNDLIARAAAQKLTEDLGQSFFVDYKPGGNAIIGTEFVAKSPADGYTLLNFSSAQTILPSTRKSLPFDVLRDFSAVSPIGRSDIVVVVNPKLPVRNMKELVALAKAQPGKLNYSSPGVGLSSHLGAELLKLQAGIDMVHVPYKGAAPALQEVISGRADLTFSGASPTVPLIKAGKIRLIGVASLKRAAAFPDMPTIEEQGFPKFEVSSAYGFLAPSATPRAVLNRLNASMQKILGTPEIRQTFNKMGLEPWHMKAEELQVWLTEEVQKWQKVAKAINYQME